MKINIELEKEDFETIKISLDLAATYWKAAAEKEKEPVHRSNFLKLHTKYSNLCDYIKSYSKY
ncbi:hypothetical protein [Adhaeribacter rhizoryzae]|uniref:Uncharacterized protein n=1 Tax=Adhaeribacter rhizoryzae TaxID=2607907 RepID=A0A5M6CV51_9BACT|nr:hypothetical protein [Adhaeribacter rhizoryzae]KAA5539128.1 hypothetical protein F0145_24995 [Adhaeribacter rhizoryzae]